jgi:acetyl-CoA carboxylase carboxyl transferase subunit alpha
LPDYPGKVTPQQVLRLKIDDMRAAGLSARKVEYLVDLALHFDQGALHVGDWATMDDEAIITELVAIRGIGRWTAEMFLIFHLMRPNVLPLDDVGLINGISKCYFSGDVVSRSDAREVALAWAPYRTVATWYIWRSLDPVPVIDTDTTVTANTEAGEGASLAKKTFLDFETPIAELENKIEELRYVQTESAVDISAEINQLAKKSQQLTKDIYSDLTPWQITKIARHAERPYTLDYVSEIFTHFVELHGDRHFADDLSIVGGLARFNGTPCMVIGQQKGRDTRERGLRNFGMSKPEGYRKALRLMKTAEKFKLPVFTFVDTPGAYPGIDAEERGQSEAIGRNIFEMAQLEVPIITTIIGEGGSGGALAISVGDQVLMLQYSIYSVISPEGCASILWKTSDKAQEAADALGITAHRLKALGVVDKIVNEPVGGAHRDPNRWPPFSSARSPTHSARSAISRCKSCWPAATSVCRVTAASPTPNLASKPARRLAHTLVQVPA